MEQLVELDWGTHNPDLKNLHFLWEELALVVLNVQWVVLPYSVYNNMTGLRFSPPVFKEYSHIYLKVGITHIVNIYLLNLWSLWALYRYEESI